MAQKTELRWQTITGGAPLLPSDSRLSQDRSPLHLSCSTSQVRSDSPKIWLRIQPDTDISYRQSLRAYTLALVFLRRPVGEVPITAKNSLARILAESTAGFVAQQRSKKADKRTLRSNQAWHEVARSSEPACSAASSGGTRPGTGDSRVDAYDVFARGVTGNGLEFKGLYTIHRAQISPASSPKKTAEISTTVTGNFSTGTGGLHDISKGTEKQKKVTTSSAGKVQCLGHALTNGVITFTTTVPDNFPEAALDGEIFLEIPLVRDPCHAEYLCYYDLAMKIEAKGVVHKFINKLLNHGTSFFGGRIVSRNRQHRYAGPFHQPTVIDFVKTY